jgi:hypothetical protein
MFTHGPQVEPSPLPATAFYNTKLLALVEIHRGTTADKFTICTVPSLGIYLDGWNSDHILLELHCKPDGSVLVSESYLSMCSFASQYTA